MSSASSFNHVILEDESLYTAMIESKQKIPNQIPELFLFTVLVQKVYFISLINEYFSFKRQKKDLLQTNEYYQAMNYKIYFSPINIIKL